MAYFPNSPLEVIKQVIDALQDDLATLKACSQTCISLLRLCRKYLFQSIKLTPRPPGPPRLPRPTRAIVLFGRLLNTNPGIADYVRNLEYQTETPDFEDDDVPRILGRFHRVQYFRLLGVGVNWNMLHPPFRESLSNIIQSRFVTRLEISNITNFPISIFIPCINLIDLKLIQLRGTVVGTRSHEEERSSISEATPQLQSFTCGFGGAECTKGLLIARCSDNLPILDFSNVRTLSVDVGKPQDLAVAQAVILATKKLETLDYIVDYSVTDTFTNFAISMNISSLSTLRRLYLEFGIEDDIQDPLCGLSEELGDFTGVNVIEEISVGVYVKNDCQCSTGDEWGRLDAVLANGFPKLSQVSLRIVIFVIASDGIPLQKKLDKLPEEQFPRLSKNTMVMFHFSTEVALV